MSEEHDKGFIEGEQSTLIKEYGKRMDKIDEKLDQIIVDVAGLKVKSGVWGVIGGSIPSAITIIIVLLKLRGLL